SQRKAREYERPDDLQIDITEVDLRMASEDLIKIADELIDNAFKYSSQGTKVCLSSYATDAHWVLTIKDHGRGMTKAQIANIGAYIQFERQFYEQQGMGLGLFLAKTLVEFYGGNLNIHSEETLGTSIRITIPL
ncbi:MAG: sensor histidine kinase, partial [Pseudanabaena sp.]